MFTTALLAVVAWFAIVATGMSVMLAMHANPLVAVGLPIIIACVAAVRIADSADRR